MATLLKLLRNAIATPERVGQVGEARINSQLNAASYWGRPGRILRNVYIPTSNSQTTEIDLVFITQKGLFVIESKNYSGYIFGNEHDQYWTVTLNGGKDLFGRFKTEKHRFYNPIKQNITHINALKAYIKPYVPCFSIVVFSNRCELKNVPAHTQNSYICQRNALNRVITDIWDNHLDCLVDEEIASIHSRLLQLTERDASFKQQHIQNIQSNLTSATQTNTCRTGSIKHACNSTTSKSQPSPNQGVLICPLCGKKLVSRTARKGPNAGKQFWGCSGYPTCKYTISYK